MNWKLLIFDCDGVLVDSEGIGNRVFAEQVIKLGLNISPEEALKRFSGIKMADSIAYVEKQLGAPVPANFITNYRQLSFAAFKAELKPIQGIEPVLQQLNKSFCVASNGPRNKIELNLRITNLLNYFEKRIFSAYEIEKWKPDPEFYLQVATQMGYDPIDCVVVEDSRFGVEAAVQANMKVFGYTAGDPLKKGELAQEGAICFQHMNQLVHLLQLN